MRLRQKGKQEKEKNNMNWVTVFTGTKILVRRRKCRSQGAREGKRARNNKKLCIETILNNLQFGKLKYYIYFDKTKRKNRIYVKQFKDEFQETMFGKNKFSGKNRNFLEKIKLFSIIVIVVKNRNFGQTSKFWSKIEILVKNRNFINNRIIGQIL